MSNWYCKQADRHSGPFSTEEMQYLRSRGQLHEDDLIRRGAHGHWVAAGTVEEIFAEDTIPLSEFLRPKAIQQPADDAANLRESAEPTRAVRATNGQGSHTSLSEGQPTYTAEEMSDDPTGKRVLIGSAIGAAFVLLLLLLLLLWPGGLGGGRGGSGGGEGVEVGQGAGAGAGDEGTGSGSGEDKASSPSGSTADPAGSPPAGDGDPVQPPPPDRITIAAIEPPTSEVPPTEETGGTSGAGDVFSGGGGGGAGGTDFFGVRASGNDLVYVVDCSGSMSGPPFSKACEELLSSIDRLKPRHRFYVYFFSDSTFRMFHPNADEPKLLSATKKNKQKVREWIEGFSPGGGTEPYGAMMESLDLDPDVIFLLSDGSFPPITVDAVRDKNKGEVTINTIGFMHRSGEAMLKPIAEQNKGEYRFVP